MAAPRETWRGFPTKVVPLPAISGAGRAGGCQLPEDTAQLPRCWSPVVLTYLKYMGLLSSSEGTKKYIYIYTTEQLDWKELYVVPWGSANSDGIGLGKGDHKVMWFSEITRVCWPSLADRGWSEHLPCRARTKEGGFGNELGCWGLSLALSVFFSA